MESDLYIYTDGGSRGNPGPAACSAVLKNQAGAIIAEESKYLNIATNNVAEYNGLILALEKALNLGYKNKSISILMDSELVIRQMKGEFKVKNIELQSLFIKAYNLTLSYKKVILKYIPRAQNKQADALVNKNLDQNQRH